jgi:hypothetical protein
MLIKDLGSSFARTARRMCSCTVQWAFLGWGVGILAHGILALGKPPRFIAKWQLKKLKELKDKM